MKGSDFLSQVKDVRNPMLSQLALNRMLAGDMPSWGLVPVRCWTEAVIDGQYYRCVYQTLRQYLSVGDDSDWVQWPLTILDLQKFCDAKFRADSDGKKWSRYYIPPKKLIKNTWAQSACKVKPQILGASSDMGWPVKIAEEQARINAAMLKAGCSLDAFSRAKKAYITAPGTTTARLHFTGWYEANGFGWEDQTTASDPRNGMVPQNATGGHEASYADYSHGCDLVLDEVYINGQSYDFAEVCAHPTLHVLVSDQGPFMPIFPNAGLALPAPALPAPPAQPASSNFKGDVYKSGGGGVTLIRASTLPAGDGGRGVVDDSSGSLLNVALGMGVALGGWMLLKRWQHAH